MAALDALVSVGGALEREDLLDVRASSWPSSTSSASSRRSTPLGAHEHVVGLVAVARLRRRRGDRGEAAAAAQRSRTPARGRRRRTGRAPRRPRRRRSARARARGGRGRRSRAARRRAGAASPGWRAEAVAITLRAAADREPDRRGGRRPRRPPTTSSFSPPRTPSVSSAWWAVRPRERERGGLLQAEALGLVGHERVGDRRELARRSRTGGDGGGSRRSTSSPGRNIVTAGPTCSTVPAASQPRISGKPDGNAAPPACPRGSSCRPG